MKNLKITKGEWEVKVRNDERFSITAKDRNLFIDCWGVGIAGVETVEEVKSNAQLIADAGTTANKCGKLPSELLEERDELIDALKELRTAIKNETNPGNALLEAYFESEKYNK